MVRRGTERADQLLRGVATELGLQMMLGTGQAKHIVAARRAFAVRGRELGLMNVTLAAALGVCRSTIAAYLDPELRGRRNSYQRRYKARNRANKPYGWDTPAWTGYRDRWPDIYTSADQVCR